MSKLTSIPKFCCVCNRTDSKNAQFMYLNKKCEEMSIRDKLEFCVPEIKNFKSSLIKLICKDCYIKLNTMYDLKTQCIKTHKSFFEWYKEIIDKEENHIEADITVNETEEEETEIKNEPLHMEIQPDIDEMVTVYRVEVIKELEEQDVEAVENNLGQYLDEFAENLASQKNSFDQGTIQHENSEMENNPFFGFSNHDIEISEAASKRTNEAMKSLTVKDKKLNLICKFCNMKFKNAEVCKDHELEHENKKPNLCLVCMKFLGPHISLKTHLQEHRRTLNCTHICDFCNERFLTANDLEYHRSVNHDRVAHNCKLCNKKFTTKFALKIHINTHLRADEDLIPCKACDKKFINQMSCDRHYQLIHEKLKPFSCHLCDKTFGLKQYLQKHLDVHSGLKRFQCTVCQKSFRYQDSLTHHLKCHKKHKCPLCDEFFMNFKEMKKHEHIHRTDLPYHCNFCGMNFKLASHLGNHISKKHIDDVKPFLKN